MWNFIRKEVTEGLRSLETWILMILFPLILTLVLASAFQDVFANKVELEDVTFGVVDESDFLGGIIVTASEDVDYITLQVMDEETALESINELGGYIRIENDKITFYDANCGGYTTQVLTAFLDRFKDYYNLEMHDPGIWQQVQMEAASAEERPSYVTLKGLRGKPAPSAFDYFGVTMLTLILAYGATQAFVNFASEQERHTLQRLKSSPTPALTVFTGKMSGLLIVAVVEVTSVVLLNSLLYDVDYDNPVLTIFAMTTLAFLFMSFGTLVATIVPNLIIGQNVIMLFIQASIIFGGSYFQISEDSGWLWTLKDLSPVGWMNNAMNEYIYGSGVGALYNAILRNVVVAAVLLIIGARQYKKLEVRNR